MIVTNILIPKVCTLEYKGEPTNALKVNYHYPVIVSELTTTDKGTQLWLTFLSGDSTNIIYESFYDFAKDWNIVGSIKFNEPYCPEKPTTDK